MTVRSTVQKEKDLKDVWPAIPIAALVLAWYLQPILAFVSAGDMAAAGMLMAVAIIFARMMIVRRSKEWPALGLIAVFAVFLSCVVIVQGWEADDRNQAQCARLEKTMLSLSPEGHHALEVFQALHCRPIGIVPSNASSHKA